MQQKLRPAPRCTGHRGASASFPENTMASFEAAIRNGAHGLESDVHISKDGEIVILHDPTLDRTTNGKGHVSEVDYKGYIDTLVTLKEPKQPVPIFSQVVDLLLKDENQHVEFLIDVKVDNDPDIIFEKIAVALSTAASDPTSAFSHRFYLGLWHPRYIPAARKYLPYLKLSYIGLSCSLARQYFWSCEAFNMHFSTLVNQNGQKFIKDAHAAGKQVFCWTVNDPGQMAQCIRWGLNVVMTDKPTVYLDLVKEIESDSDKYETKIAKSDWYTWQRMAYYTLVPKMTDLLERRNLDRIEPLRLSATA